MDTSAALPASATNDPGWFAALRRWLAVDPWRADLTFGAVVAVAGVLTALGAPSAEGLRDASAWSVALNLVAGVGVALRRRAPSLAATLAGSAAGLHAVGDFVGPVPVLALLVTLYAEAAYGVRRQAVWSLAGVCVVVVAITAGDGDGVTWVSLASNLAVFTIPWFLGDNLRNRRALEAELVERARRAEQDRNDVAERAVATERARIARELHDVVAHAMGVMVVQAGAARRVLRTRPDDAETALTAIEGTGRGALGEMRRLVGVLRETAGLADRSPQPTLERLPELLEAVEDPDHPVDLAVTGTVRPLAPGIDLTAYRIVQEGVTNARRHAGPARVAVTVDYGSTALTVAVVDDGRGAAAGPSPTDGPGHGLVGMRERVGLYGGRLRVGPQPGGGYEVRAVLPLEPA